MNFAVKPASLVIMGVLYILAVLTFAALLSVTAKQIETLQEEVKYSVHTHQLHLQQDGGYQGVSGAFKVKTQSTTVNGITDDIKVSKPSLLICIKQ